MPRIAWSAHKPWQRFSDLHTIAVRIANEPHPLLQHPAVAHAVGAAEHVPAMGKRPQSPLIHFLAVVFAGWLNRNQQQALEYLREENRGLREMLGGRRLRFTAYRCPAPPPRDRRQGVGSPLAGRHCHARHTGHHPGLAPSAGRPQVDVRARREEAPARHEGHRPVGPALRARKPAVGYNCIQGALKNVGHQVAPNTIKRILQRNGLAPAPERGRRTTWRTFLKAHMDATAAADFFTTEVWTARGLVTHYTLFVIHLGTRAVEVVGTTVSPDAVFMKQAALALTDPAEGFLRGKRFLVIDRDAKFTDAFKAVLKDAGVRPLLCPPSAPNCNSFAERWVRSVKDECLDRLVFFGVDALRRALRRYVAHYNAERDHQGIDNQLIAPRHPVGSATGSIARRERLGGMLSYYFRRAA